ncbi:hypothetical protein R5R35_001322 [Gryllus longicercus]|uniref:Scavenger receptor class B member 1 n=1 Tax=Gryllus longicercus TaxID=2509291 RepID=A0AAN9V9G3_9ORTH
MKIFRQSLRVLVPGYERGRWRWTLQHVSRSLGPRVSGPGSVAVPASAAANAVAAAARKRKLCKQAKSLENARKAKQATDSKGAEKIWMGRGESAGDVFTPFCLFHWAVALMLAGVFAVCTGILILTLDPYTLVFNAKVQLSDGGEAFEVWRKPPVDLYLKVWLFNVTNADAFMNGEDEKLHFEEVGPYIYRELLEHADVHFNDNNTLTAHPKHPLVWAEDLNTHREDDLLILPNIALLSIASVIKDASYFTRLGLNLLIKQTDSQPLVQMTAREFMFGYETSLTTLGNKVLPSWIFFDKIGLIDRMYDFTGDTMTVHTGVDDVRKSGLIDRYRGLHYIPEWPENCSIAKGASDGSKFASLIAPNDQLVMYRKSLCRAMPMQMIDETTKGGLPAYVYTWKDGILDNGLRDPHNKCFCRHNRCLPEGIMDVEECYYGFPIVLSYPHFYLADPAVRNMTVGSFPDKEKHETRFFIEPRSGLPLQTNVRMQINMALGDVSRIHRVPRFSNLIFPMLWLEITVESLPPFLQNKFFFYLEIAPIMLKVILYASLIGGPLLLIGSILRVYWNSFFKKEIKEDYSTDMEFSQKHMNIIRADRRSSLKAKEMDVYFTSLLMSPSIDEENSTSKDNDTV